MCGQQDGDGLFHRPHHLGNHVPGALDDDDIPYPHVFGSDFILIVQCGARHGDAAHRRRIQHGYGRQHAGASHLDLNVAHTRVYLLRRELERHGEPRRTGRKSQRFLRLQIVLLGYRAVDFHSVGFALLPHFCRIRFHLSRRGAQPSARRHGKTIFMEGIHDESATASRRPIPPHPYCRPENAAGAKPSPRCPTGGPLRRRHCADWRKASARPRPASR